MLIEEFMPEYDMVEHHEADVAAPTDEVYAAAVGLDLSKTRWSRLLFMVRGVPHLLTGKFKPSSSFGLEQFEAMGFVKLKEDIGTELVLGTVGRFWRPTSGMERIRAEDFKTFDRPGYAKAVMNLRVEPSDGGSTLITETRVQCTSEEAHKKFKAYWTLIGPFSGFIRTEMLRAIRNSAERQAVAQS